MAINQLRLSELKHLEQCERALADAYRFHPPLPAGLAEHELLLIAKHHLEHAAMLRGRIVALGGVPNEEPDDFWLTGFDVTALLRAERASLASYHDHLTDMDSATARLVQDFVMNDHAWAMALLDPDYEPDRDGELVNVP